MIYFRECYCKTVESCHDGMSCHNIVGHKECGNGVCKTDPNTKCGKLQAAGIKIGCPE